MTDLTLRADPAPDAVKRRLQTLAERAIGAYRLDGRVTLLNHTINATWRVDARSRGTGERQRFVLRLYRPDVYSPATVRSEVAWLRALRAGGGLEVPPPVATADGDALVTLAEEGETPRLGVLFRWLEGRFVTGAPTPGQAERIGELLGRLHAFSDGFEEPEGFERPRFDLEGLLGAGETAGEGFLSRSDRRHLGEATAYLRRELAGLEEQPGAFGLIHGDLTPKNCLFDDGEVRALDFADFGRGFYAYDVATSLLRWTEEERYRELRTEFLAGYRRVRSFPPAQEAVIEEFQLCRRIYLLRWLCRFLELPEIRERARDGFPFILAQIRRFLDRRATSRPAGLSSLSTVELLHRLHQRDVELWAEGDRLRFSAPPGVLSGELKEELKKRKAEVLRFLGETMASTGVAGPPLVRVPRTVPLPLSFAQERLWFFDRYQPGSTAYNMSTLFRLRGPLRIEALGSSLDEIVRRHEVLRTTFHEVDGKPVQRIAPSRALPLPVIDLGRLAGETRSSAALRLARLQARRPFDLSRGPLLRFFLLRLTDAEHLFQLTIHHIVSDGWSSGVLGRELRALYEACLERRFVPGVVTPLPELAIQYADFAHWQRRWLQGQVLERQLGHWRRELAGAPHVLELPTDRPRPARPAYASRKLVRWLPPSLREGLEALCHREGCTPFMALLATFAVLLWRYTGRRDLLVGTPIANRSRGELEALIGFFANTLVLRVRVVRRATFRELLERVRQITLTAYENQDLPFEKVVEAVQPERAVGHNPLVQVVFALQNTPARPTRSSAALEMEVEPAESGQTVFDLIANMEEAPAGLRLSLRYPRALFDGSKIARLARHFQALLAEAVADPDELLEELRILTPAERHQLCREYSDTRRRGPEDERSLPELFAAQARRRPEAAAVDFEGQWLSYRELSRRADRLAHRLLGLGASAGSIIAFSLGSPPSVVVTMLAILKASGAYLPLDSTYPAPRLRFMLEDTGARLVIVDESTRALVEGLGEGPQIISLDGAHGQERDGEPPLSCGPDSVAYVLYTSGSTGVPKGVAVPHRAIRRLALRSSYLEARPEDRFAQISNVSFDAVTFEIWGALLNGACVAGIRKKVILSPARFAGELRDRRVSAMFLTTALFNQTAREVPAAFRTVRHVMVGGEAVDPEWTRAVLAAGPPPRLLNGYGPTESTTFASFYRITSVAPGAVRVPIGWPIGNTSLLVLDAGLRPVGLGVAGELMIGGEGLALGYLARPRRTAERFVPNPLGEEPGERLYRTGDRVWRRFDGAMEYLGRFDHQVKVRGFRIELGEIEAALERCPAVGQCVVLARADPPGDRRLVAYLVADPSRAPAARELRAMLAASLPDYMLPSAFVVLDALPLTPNGKVDREALPPPPGGGGTPDAEASPRQDPIGELVAGIWADVLAVDRVAPEDDFFELGGHSLLATQVVSRLRAVAGVEVPLQRLFESSILADLVAFVRDALRRKRVAALPPVTHVPRDRELPLSFAQQRLWFLDQLEPGSPRYNIPAAVRLRGTAPHRLLARVFEEVVRRHEALRTRFVARDGQPLQVIDEDLSVELPCVDLGGLPPAVRETETRRLAAAAARRPFDLATAPLIRLALLRLAPADQVALVTMHHIVSDGWSMGVFLRELSVLFEAFSQGRPSPLPELPLQYADFAFWQRSWLGGEVLESELAYWKEQLAGMPRRLTLPTDRPRPAVPSWRGRRLAVALGRPLSERLAALGKKHGMTLFMTLLAAFEVLLSRASGQLDVAVGTPIAGRTTRELEGLIGFFVNTLVLRTDLSAARDETFLQWAARVRRTALDAYVHQNVPFERLVEELQPERDLGVTPLFQVMLVLQNAPRSSWRTPGLTLEPLRNAGEDATAMFDLTLSLQERDAGLGGTLEYSSDLFDATTVRRLRAHFERLLAAIVEDPQRRLPELPWTTPAERHQILTEWSGSPAVAPGALVHELFEEQAATTPDAVAMVCDAERWTYGDLNRRANRLAHALRSHGVSPEVIVAVAAEHPPERVVGLLAVLKAGGAWLSVGPELPADRLAFMLEDAAAAVLVSRQPLRGRAILDPREETWDDRQPETNPRGSADPRNLAYLLYTSGSTGRPKGVAVTHGALAGHCRTVRREIGLTSADRVLQTASFSFDVALEQTLPALTCGAQLVLEGPDFLLASGFSDRLRALAVTVADLPAGFWHEWVAAEPECATPVPPLRLVSVGGDVMAVESACRWDRTPMAAAELVNAYGPTEATISALIFRVPARSPELVCRHRVPIGRPLAGRRGFVLDRRGRTVPVGVPGELHLGGVLARGYRKRAALTAEQFVPDPFSATSGERLYRTGDRVRYRQDGEIDFLGRIDDQVKVRGYRVELREIETVLGRHPAVREAVVLAREDGGTARLVACVAARGGPTAGELRDFLRGRLPEYMVPAHFLMLDAFPLTPGNKVDRRALARLPLPGRPAGSREKAPRDLLELRLLRIWEELLGIEVAGTRTGFFALGGHSLLAVRLMARIRHEFGRDLPLTALFQQGTVEGLAALLREPAGGRRRDALVAIRPAGSRPPFFCVHPIGGDVLCYSELARHLDVEQPFYGLQRPDPDLQPFASIEEMAAHYVEAVREVRPVGPYLLGGWSMGGVVAFEMARQLADRKEQVSRLVLLDTPPPDDGSRETDERMLAWIFARDLGRILGASSTASPEELESFATASEVLAFLFAELEAAELVPPGLDLSWIERRFAIFRENDRVLRRYRARPYPGRLDLLATRALAASAAEPGWGEVAEGGVEVREVPGDHYSTLKPPHVRQTAERLLTILQAPGLNT